MSELTIDEKAAAAIRAAINAALDARLGTVEQTLRDTNDGIRTIREVLLGEDGKPETSIVWRVRSLEDWRKDIDSFLRTLMLFLAPVGAALIIAILGFLWGLLTNHIDVMVH